jgi:hypothetical protein
MNYVTKEITREYRLDFNNGETHWQDPIPPEVTSGVLGKPTTRVITRTSLLAWSLMMSLGEVTMADVTADGWMRICVSSDDDFDEDSLTRDIADMLRAVIAVRRHGEDIVAEGTSNRLETGPVGPLWMNHGYAQSPRELSAV